MRKSKYYNEDRVISALTDGTLSVKGAKNLIHYHKGKGNTFNVIVLERGLEDYYNMLDMLERINEQQDGDEWIGHRD